jgi:aconitate hydratase
MGLVPGDLVEVDWNLAALTPRCDVAVRLHRASSCAIERGVAIALLDTEREVALVQAGGIIPMILVRSLEMSTSATFALKSVQ